MYIVYYLSFLIRFVDRNTYNISFLKFICLLLYLFLFIIYVYLYSLFILLFELFFSYLIVKLLGHRSTADLSRRLLIYLFIW